MKKIIFHAFLLLFTLLVSLPLWPALGHALPQNQSPYSQTLKASSPRPTLTKAVICSSLQDNKPFDPGIIFSVGQQEVLCFNEFDKITKTSYIFHRWFHRDRLIKTIKLKLKPPRWSTLSKIQPREEDKGPWRVEITDQKGNMIKILRFSLVN